MAPKNKHLSECESRMIPTPSFRKLALKHDTKNELDVKGRIKVSEFVDEESAYARHKTLENAERRERRREEELLRYELYIQRLQNEYPEIFTRK